MPIIWHQDRPWYRQGAIMTLYTCWQPGIEQGCKNVHRTMAQAEGCIAANSTIAGLHNASPGSWEIMAGNKTALRPYLSLPMVCTIKPPLRDALTPAMLYQHKPKPTPKHHDAPSTLPSALLLLLTSLGRHTWRACIGILGHRQRGGRRH